MLRLKAGTYFEEYVGFDGRSNIPTLETRDGYLRGFIPSGVDRVLIDNIQIFVELEEVNHLGFFQDDYIRYGYGPKLVQYDPKQEFRTEVDIRKTKKTYKQACVDAARRIFDEHVGPITLLFSGGLDSEIMVRAFHESGVPFQVFTLRFHDDLNEHDMRDVYKLKHELTDVGFYIMDFDILSFFEDGEYKKYVEQYRTTFPELALHLKAIDMVKGTIPILAGNTPGVALFDGVPNYYLPIDQFYCYHRFFSLNNMFGVGHFLIYSPDQFYSSITNRKYLDCFRSGAFTYADKCKIYQTGGFSHIERTEKYTGFEKIRKMYSEKHDRLYGLNFQFMDDYDRLSMMDNHYEVENA